MCQLFLKKNKQFSWGNCYTLTTCSASVSTTTLEKAEEKLLAKFFLFYKRKLKTCNHENAVVRYCGAIDYWMVAGSFLLECPWNYSYSDCSGNNFVAVGYYSQCLRVSLIYMVHSISKATVLYCSHFFKFIVVVNSEGFFIGYKCSLRRAAKHKPSGRL